MTNINLNLKAGAGGYGEYNVAMSCDGGNGFSLSINGGTHGNYCHIKTDKKEAIKLLRALEMILQD